MSLASKLRAILESKRRIKDAINRQDVSFEDSLPFRQYPDKILEIERPNLAEGAIHPDDFTQDMIYEPSKGQAWSRVDVYYDLDVTYGICEKYIYPPYTYFNVAGTETPPSDPDSSPEEYRNLVKTSRIKITDNGWPTTYFEHLLICENDQYIGVYFLLRNCRVTASSFWDRANAADFSNSTFQLTGGICILTNKSNDSWTRERDTFSQEFKISQIKYCDRTLYYEVMDSVGVKACVPIWPIPTLFELDVNSIQEGVAQAGNVLTAAWHGRDIRVCYLDPGDTSRRKFQATENTIVDGISYLPLSQSDLIRYQTNGWCYLYFWGDFDVINFDQIAEADAATDAEIEAALREVFGSYMDR